MVRSGAPAGSLLSDLVASGDVVPVELPLSLLPDGVILDPSPVAAVTDLPPNTIATAATFA